MPACTGEGAAGLPIGSVRMAFGVLVLVLVGAVSMVDITVDMTVDSRAAVLVESQSTVDRTVDRTVDVTVDRTIGMGSRLMGVVGAGSTVDMTVDTTVDSAAAVAMEEIEPPTAGAAVEATQ